MIYLTSIVSPPSLMDDSDAVEAQNRPNYVDFGGLGDCPARWSRIFGKVTLSWWLMNVGYEVFGFHDWTARIAFALTAIGLAWLTAAFGRVGIWQGWRLSTPAW